ncbi:hypothetical protein ACFZC6_43765 [Streptomyces ossamyceticus]|uniref:hypothetical protein n=1 Tax=Streptomyces ossamyceticus TaxID=249581 RepID=UPI0036E16369
MPLSRRLFVMTATTAATSGAAPGLPLMAPTSDVTRLREFRDRVDRELPEDLASGARVAAEPGAVTVDLGTTREVDRVRLAEDIRHGQQIERLVVEARRAGAWVQVATAGAVGASRILPLPAPYGRGAGGSG